MVKDKFEEFDLDALSRLNTPQADHKRRDDIIAQAVSAFEKERQKNIKSSQGMVMGERLNVVLKQLWRQTMNHKFASGTALASMLVLGFGGYYGYQHFIKRESSQLLAQAGVTVMWNSPFGPLGTEYPDSVRKGNSDQSPILGSDMSTEHAKEAVVNMPDSQQTAKVESTSKIVRYSTSRSADWGGDFSTSGDVPFNEAVPPFKWEGHYVGGQVRADAKTDGEPYSLEQKYARIDARGNEDDIRQYPSQSSGDRFPKANEYPLTQVKEQPVSTFSIDVDTASYAYVRRSLEGGKLPDPQSVRVEEMVNYFPYNWPKPEDKSVPFRTTVTLMPTPWKAGTELMHVAIQGYDVDKKLTPNANLVFLIDISGSMYSADRLPLLKTSLKMLLNQLKPTDKVSIVTYAGDASTALESTSVANKQKIIDVLDRLEAGGGTAGGDGLKLAYDQARKGFIKDGVNRIFLASDGDFNVGASSDDEMKTLVEKERKDGIFLSVLGFGMGNYQDAMMQTLAQNGNGVAAYIDNLSEARKVLVEGAGSNLFTIAKDVKIQVEFNPDKIAEYRLIGYETRALAREDFNNDKVDAGDIGSGHKVTAIYEITPVDSPARLRDDLRYQPTEKSDNNNQELAFLRIRYKQPDSDKSQLIETPVTKAQMVQSFDVAPQDVRFSVSVAAFAQKLRGIDQLQDYSYDAIRDMAVKARGDDPSGYRSGFISLVDLAKSLNH